MEDCFSATQRLLKSGTYVCTAAVEPLNNGHVGTSCSVHYREVSSLRRLEMYVLAL